jgi:formylglycine-generating enzyme required for sulfatase activity
LDDALAERQGRIALALMRLDAPARVWPLFEFRDDPSVRTELIHEFARYGIDPMHVVRRLRTEGDVSARRALVLCLGGYPKQDLAGAEERALEAELLKWYREHPDPGLHSAVDWVLRQRWGLAERLVQIDNELASRDLPKDRNWFVNGQGQTYAIVREPVRFMMGLNPDDRELYAAYPTPEGQSRVRATTAWHERLIPRSFAIAMREVTVAEYSRFLDTKPVGVEDHRVHNHFRVFFPTPGCAVGDIDWYAGARYCNWLSASEAIPKAQWCYPDTIGPGMELPKDHLERTGYRLPTEGEWEYGCRFRTVSSRAFGGSLKRCRAYAWTLSNSAGVAHPAGMLKPNDLGLFDTIGNLGEWCCDPCRDPTDGYPVPAGKVPLLDKLELAPFSEDTVRRVRGPTTGSPTQHSFSGYRSSHWPGNPASHLGFRPVRTLPRETSSQSTAPSVSLP